VTILVGAPRNTVAERTIDGTAAGIPDKITQPPPLPKQFAFTFSMPYGQGDEFPREPEEFDRMLGLLKSAGYNTVHCPYTPWRHELFKKHKMKMMVDVLAWKPPVEADIRDPAQRDKVRQLCLKAKGSDAIWGYNLWNERLDWCGNFEYLDAWIRMLRTWDPTHPIWVGTYRYLYCEHFPTNPGVHGWYDYHWARGMGWNLKMLNFYRGIAKKHHGSMGKWLLILDYNRNLYTLNTSIAHGVKTVIWFIGGPYAAREPDTSKRWDKDSHLIRIGQHMAPLYELIGQMGLPTAVYSTTTRRTADNKDKAPGLPADTTAFHEDHWLQIRQGEVICGFFRLPDKSKVAYIANHNAYAWQGVVMEVKQANETPTAVLQFDREKHDWKPLGTRKLVNFAIPPADACVFRFEPGDNKLEDDASTEAKDYDPQGHFQRIRRLLDERGELADGEQPSAVYSHPTKRTRDNRDKEAGLPEGAIAYPKDFPVQAVQGELIAGVFELKNRDRVICYANANALAWQGGLIVPKQEKENPIVIDELNQEAGDWIKLGTWADVNFPVPPGGSAVFRFRRVSP
jgi:hypothetical protein